MFTVVASGKKISRVLIILLLSAVLLTAVVFTASGKSDENVAEIKAENSESRADFLNSLGYDIDTAVKEEKREVVIPYEFSDIYNSYNLLQQSAGFDLIPFKGKTVTQYTVKLNENGRNDVYAHILIFDGNIIGGDITALSVDDGYMLPLENKNKKQE